MYINSYVVILLALPFNIFINLFNLILLCTLAYKYSLDVMPGLFFLKYSFLDPFGLKFNFFRLYNYFIRLVKKFYFFIGFFFAKF